MLSQHVLGVLVHCRPRHKVFLYTFNDSIKGDANTNIEGLRRTLVALYSGEQPMPRTLFVQVRPLYPNPACSFDRNPSKPPQGDNASDNKCWAVLLFLAMLVHHGYTKVVYFSFLLVGHTHEDIDQLFSVISRFFRRMGQFQAKTPQGFLTEMVGSLDERFDVVSEAMLCTADCALEAVEPDPRRKHRPPQPPDPDSGSGQLNPCRNKSIEGIQHRTLQCLDTVDDDGVRAPHTFRITRRS